MFLKQFLSSDLLPPPAPPGNMLLLLPSLEKTSVTIVCVYCIHDGHPLKLPPLMKQMT